MTATFTPTARELLARLNTPEARAERAENQRRRDAIDAQIEAEAVEYAHTHYAHLPTPGSQS